MFQKFFIWLLIFTLFLTSTFLTNAADEIPKVQFLVEDTGNDIIKISLNLSNVSTSGFKCKFNYNKDAILPVDYKSFQITNSNENIAKKVIDFKNVNLITDLDYDFGVIYLSSEFSNKETIVDSTKLFEFYFKKVSKNQITINLVDDNEVKTGFEFLGNSTYHNYLIEVSSDNELSKNYISFGTLISPDDIKNKQIETINKENEKLSNIYVFAINNYAVLSRNALRWCDKDNKKVMPYLKDGNIMLPLRFITEAIGGEILYDYATEEISINYNDNKVSFKLDNFNFTACELVHDRTFVSSDFIETVFSHVITYVDKDKMVYVTPKDNLWNSENELEKGLVSKIKLVLSPLVRDLAY